MKLYLLLSKETITVNKFNSFLTLLVIVFCAPIVFGQESKPNKPKVLILGSFHFANPGLDVANSRVDDVFAPKRQKEIREIIESLKKFRPTKIAVEAEFESPMVASQYARYLNGTYKLTRNEIDQIGYRLAKEMGHQKVFAIDWKGKFDFDKVVGYARTNDQTKVIDSFISKIKGAAQKQTEDLKTKTFREVFLSMNSKKTQEIFYRLYFSFVQFGKGKNYVGTNLLRDWFERNLKIYTNIYRISNDGDRILVIIGASHVPIIKRFLTVSKFEIIEANEFL